MARLHVVLCGLVLAWSAALATGDTTDPRFDWERPPATPSRDLFALTSFKSSRTLAETTTWLKGALERYGSVKTALGREEISKVVFAGCTLRWRRKQDMGRTMTHVFDSTVDLRDVDLSYGRVQTSTGQTSIHTRHEFTVAEEYFENGKSKGPPRPAKEWSARFAVRNEDLMPERISWALIHAARLCGAPVPAPR